jgi:hypothetical protein
MTTEELNKEVVKNDRKPLFSGQQSDWIRDKLGKEIYDRFEIELHKDRAEQDGYVTFEGPKTYYWYLKDIVDHWGAKAVVSS